MECVTPNHKKRCKGNQKKGGKKLPKNFFFSHNFIATRALETHQKKTGMEGQLYHIFGWNLIFSESVADSPDGFDIFCGMA